MNLTSWILRGVPAPVLAVGRRITRRPRVYIERTRTRREFSSDGHRYIRYMTPKDGLAHAGLPSRNCEAQVTKDYHRIEKGLALRSPKRPFGKDVETRLNMLVSQVGDSAYGNHARTALEALASWNASGTVDNIVSPIAEHAPRGMLDIEGFFSTRYSVRDFSERVVSCDLLERGSRIALSAPSVCNRQPWRCRYFTGDSRRAVLEYQNGNRGFGSSIPVIGIVTVDLRLFSGVGERNQAWIEGGLFAMNLALALHALGLDTCMLNMSVTNSVADNLRHEFNIDDAEIIIMMLGIGYGREGHRRARSPRRSLSEVVSFYD